jgi:CRP-like cAMP-binding protein
MFDHLTEAGLKSLARHVSWRRYTAGTVLFQTGEPVHGMYLIESGSVELYRVSLSGQEQILALLRAGEPLAEWAVFGGGVYPVSAMCISASRLALVRREALDTLLRTDAEFALKVVTGISLKLRRALGLIEDFGLRDARGRVASYLVGHLPPDAVPGCTLILPVAQAVVARLLGIRAETLSRSLRQFRLEGILEPRARRQLLIHDPKRLRAVVGA